MKTKTNITNTRKSVTQTEGLGSESDKQFLPSDSKTPNTDRPRIDYAKRQTNRQLTTRDLLALLRTQAPDFYNLAQVVGKWVWIQFTDKQPPTITAQLAEFGFHWNNKRQCWQHPCGPVTVDASPDDPRAKYGATFAADMQPA
jgi:hypothetical protein